MTSLIGRNIRRLRRRSGYSQAQLAKGARISQAWVCRLETGDKNPTLASVTRIARALGVNPTSAIRPSLDRFFRGLRRRNACKSLIVGGRVPRKRL
jgi:transcriptional regulator with XRE-family HTH domain